MGFFERNRAELAERGVDPGRLPPGQYVTERFPVLHVGDVPTYAPDLSDWDLTITGLVGREVQLSFDELTALPSVDVTADIHCVTKWSKFDTRWTGIRVADLFEVAGGTRTGATHVVEHAEYGYTTNVPLDDLLDDGIVAYRFGGLPLEPEHGYPARVVIPHLYFWKSAKWLRGLEVVSGDRPGFWEQNGYHNHGDPFREQRYWGD